MAKPGNLICRPSTLIGLYQVTVVPAVDCLQECIQLLCVLLLATKTDNVDSHIVLLELLSNLDQGLLQAQQQSKGQAIIRVASPIIS